MGEWAVSTGPVTGVLDLIDQCPAERQERLSYTLNRTTIQGGDVDGFQFAPPGNDAGYLWYSYHTINMLQQWLFDHPNFVIPNFKSTAFDGVTPSPTAVDSNYQQEQGAVIPGDNLNRQRFGGVRTNTGDWYATIGTYNDTLRGVPKEIWKNGAYLQAVPDGGDPVNDSSSKVGMIHDWVQDRVFYIPYNASSAQTIASHIYLLDGVGGATLWHSGTDESVGRWSNTGQSAMLFAPNNRIWLQFKDIDNWSTFGGNQGWLHLDTNGNELGRWVSSFADTTTKGIHVCPDGGLIVEDRGDVFGSRWKKIDATTYTAARIVCQNPLSFGATFYYPNAVMPKTTAYTGSYVLTTRARGWANIGDASGDYGGIAQWHSQATSFYEIHNSAVDQLA
ncbi:MAG: hypothetical protein HKN81_05325 [Gammaproteobacteria bacterium]|nr:hypothetical protein [Gammaproteobacteria bacterium]